MCCVHQWCSCSSLIIIYQRKQREAETARVDLDITGFQQMILPHSYCRYHYMELETSVAAVYKISEMT